MIPIVKSYPEPSLNKRKIQINVLVLIFYVTLILSLVIESQRG